MKRFLSSLLMSVFCLGVGSAVAADAITTANVNLRNGPSTRYGVQASIPAGYPISVGQCQGSWCLVNAGGYRGWMASTYIAFKEGMQPARPYVQSPAPVIIAPGIVGGYGYYDRPRRPHYRHRPPPPPPAFHRPPPPPGYYRPRPDYHRPPPDFHRPPPPHHGHYGPPPMRPHGGPYGGYR